MEWDWLPRWRLEFRFFCSCDQLFICHAIDSASAVCRPLDTGQYPCWYNGGILITSQSMFPTQNDEDMRSYSQLALDSSLGFYGKSRTRRLLCESLLNIHESRTLIGAQSFSWQFFASLCRNLTWYWPVTRDNAGMANLELEHATLVEQVVVLIQVIQRHVILGLRQYLASLARKLHSARYFTCFQALLGGDLLQTDQKG